VAVPELGEYFFKDREFTRFLTGHREVTLTRHRTDEVVAMATVRNHYDDVAAVQYVSVLMTGEELSFSEVSNFIGNMRVVLDMPRATEIRTSTPYTWDSALDSMALESLPFCNRVLLYVGIKLSEDQKDHIFGLASSQGLSILIRDATYAEYRTSVDKPLAFLSHDSGDKEFVRNLASQMQRMLCTVWFDEFQLKPGDNMRESLDRGLRECGKCILILSPSYIDNKRWAAAEFNAAMTQHMGLGGGRVIPVLVGVSHEAIADYSPLLSSLYAASFDGDMEALASQLMRAVMS
jgi:hypothetical protein